MGILSYLGKLFTGSAATEEEAMSQSISKLLEGNQRFQQGKFTSQKPLYDKLVSEGQFPTALIVTCSDSRVLTDDIFDAPPGTCFVIRNVGGFVPPYQPDDNCHGTTAAIEFAISVLKVKAAIVLCHSQCAGVAKASSHQAAEEVAGSPIIGNWLTAMDLPKDVPNPDDSERIAARISVKNLSEIPCVKEAHDKGELELAAMRFDMTTGAIEVL